MKLWHVLLGIAISIIGASSLFAQSSMGGRGYVTYGTTALTSTATFEAVGGETHVAGFGGGGSLTGLWRGLFADVAVSQQNVTGERVFMNERATYRLGIPLRIAMRPVDVAVGWRFVRGRISPYAGVGITRVSYREHGDFAQPGDDVSRQASGALMIGGADVAILNWVHVGGEIRSRFISGVLGSDGVSEVLGDNGLGGVSASLRISVGR